MSGIDKTSIDGSSDPGGMTDIAISSWPGLLVGALAYFLLGAAWFTPLFGKQYDRAVGVVRRPDQRFGPIYYVMPLVGAVLATAALAALSAALDPTSVADAARLGLVAGLGFGVAVSVTNAVLPVVAKPLLLGAVTGGYHLAASVTAAIVLQLLS